VRDLIVFLVVIVFFAASAGFVRIAGKP